MTAAMKWSSLPSNAAKLRSTNISAEQFFIALKDVGTEAIFLRPFPQVLQFAQTLARSGKYLMGTINNESREINDYRIETFGLRTIFRVFISSCFVGLRKPESGIYRLACDITQIPAEECTFIDDRVLNLECAAKLGMNKIEMMNLEQLKTELQKLSVSP